MAAAGAGSGAPPGAGTGPLAVGGPSPGARTEPAAAGWPSPGGLRPVPGAPARDPLDHGGADAGMGRRPGCGCPHEGGWVFHDGLHHW